MKHTLPTQLKYWLFAGLLLAALLPAKAQYVTIPDATFASWLKSNGYAACMNGNQLDTTCNAVLTAGSLSCKAVPVRDLTGIQYFKKLHFLDCSNDSLYAVPPLPQSLWQFICSHNNISALSNLPDSITSLDCEYNKLPALPTLPPDLYSLTCGNNQLTALPQLPNVMQSLYCSNNPITAIARFPDSLISLSCAGCQLTSLPPFPNSIGFLELEQNQISVLPALPQSVTSIFCDANNLTSLPQLPAGLRFLKCGLNMIGSLPALPNSLLYLDFYGNLITSIPSLPPHLNYLCASVNKLQALPDLPDSLQVLQCVFNNIASLPRLPNTITDLEVGGNQLNSIPELPDSLNIFYCWSNSGITCLPQLKRIVNLDFTFTGVTCLPDYGSVTSSNPALDTVPLCGLFNQTGCQPFWQVSGRAFYDPNSDCIFDSMDAGTNYVKTQLFSNGALLQQAFTGGGGFYSFDSVPYGSYTIQVDTSNLPFTMNCNDSSYLGLTLSPADSLSYGNNFAFKCRTQGFDLGLQSIINKNIPRPNAIFALNTIAGDLSQLYGAHCAAGTGGQLQMVYSGPLTYVVPANNALAPTSVSADSLTWTIADFGASNDLSAFNVLFKIDSLAVPGTSVCFTVNVTPIAGDYNPSNNTLTYCFPVVNALDPNEKEVYPSGNTDTSVQWLTYTIRFQNTGTATAQNIRITDTLDSNLDPSTFQLLNYSAKNLTQIFGKVVVFNFPNINLPDSATGDSASRGYVQYKIRLLNALPPGTQIQNTAYIYFDLNSAVATNTTVNTITSDTTTGVKYLYNSSFLLTLYPNPANNLLYIKTEGLHAEGLIIYDVDGRAVAKQAFTPEIDIHNLTPGVYLLEVLSAEGVARKRWVKM